MKIYFIQSTPYDSSGGLVKKSRLYFVGLAPAILAALVDDWEFEVCLETIEPVDFDSDADIIAVSGMGHAIIRSIEIAKAFSARGKTVVMGGYMASLMPEEALKYCNSVVIGDAEEVFPQLLADYRNGCMKSRYYMPLAKLSYPLPRYELLTAKKIGNFLPVQAGRGCPHSCSFCSVACLYRGRYLKRNIDEVMRDIREVKRLGYKRFLLLDDNICSDKAYMRELCGQIKTLKMQWFSQCSIQIADDGELLALVADSGCAALSFGLESISQESLSYMNKGWAKVCDYERQLAKIAAAGIDLSTEMVVGADGDTPESIEQTADFIVLNKIAIPRFYILTPIPGTDFFKETQAQGRIVNEDIYSYNGAQAVHRPLRMTAEELTAAYWKLYLQVFSVWAIIRRTLLKRGFWRAPLKHFFYFYVNLYYRYQIRRGIPPNII
ncbi:MAG: B12-binding domain-containing radical SAM protein [Clostridiales Family XIII bacterium]|jgi:radical SAM superfamily enzyme YgiQ (UPF0313 family)|nr:B12-binding domain-containing radical SAM protein [Clostridiales Family XIII bacterium]